VGRTVGRFPQAAGRLSPSILPEYSPAPTLRVIRGTEADQYGEELFAPEFTVGAHSDRMGLRLGGPRLARRSTGELVSAPVAPGTVQVPPEGQPILLLADAQTIGGYPQAAHVVSVDLPLAAQLRPGDRVRFREVSLPEAHRLLQLRERELARLRAGLGR
jgi:antagonist of KipI